MVKSIDEQMAELERYVDNVSKLSTSKSTNNYDDYMVNFCSSCLNMIVYSTYTVEDCIRYCLKLGEMNNISEGLALIKGAVAVLETKNPSACTNIVPCLGILQSMIKHTESILS
jgi:hypothetical protein